MIMRKLIAITLVLLCLGASACSTSSIDENQPSSEKTKSDLTDSSRASKYTNILPEEAKKRLETEKGIILLDVRTQEEYLEKHIPNSLLIPVDVIEKEAPVKLTDKNATLFVYCRSGNRSVTASQALVKMGYTNVYNLGGINDWRYETVSGK